VRTRGVILDVVAIQPGEHDAAAIVERMTAAITPRTKVMSVSHLLSSTGLRMPIAQLCAAARAHEVISVVDGAQAVGAIAVDVKALGCDVYATSGHKWLLAPKGTGLLYLRRELGARVDPIQLQSGRGAYTASTGVCSLPSVIGLGAAIEYIGAKGIAAVETHNLALRARLDAALATVPKLAVVSAHESALASPLVSYRLPDAIKAGPLQQRLHQAHRVFVKVVPGNWFNGQRISTHLFNTEQDVDALIAALRAELA
jgi:selenocysteine lyase/cysteine desulfurase